MRASMCAAATALVVFSLGAAGDPETFDASRVTWTRLEFKAKKLFLTAHSSVRLGAVIDDGEVLAIEIESTVAGRESLANVQFEPRRGAAFGKEKQRRGKKAYRKATRFDKAGASVVRRAPLSKEEAGRPYDEWGKVEEFFYPRPEDGSCDVLSDPAVLFYAVSATALPIHGRLCVFSDKQMVPVEIVTLGRERLEVGYEEVEGSSRRRRDGDVEVWRVAVRPLASAEDFELLGLEGGVEILIDQKTRVPVRLEGKLGSLGRVAVELEEVELGRLDSQTVLHHRITD